MNDIDLKTLSDEEKLNLFEELENDLGIYAIATIFRDDVAEIIGQYCDYEELKIPSRETINSAIQYVIRKMPSPDNNQLREWVLEKALEIEGIKND